MPESLKPAELEILRRIVSRFFNLRRGTPVQRTRISLGEDRGILDHLVKIGCIRTDAGEYIPTFMALDYMDDSEVRKYAVGAVDAVLAAFRSLYIKGEGEKNTFSFEDIVVEVQSRFPFLEKNDVLPALILATELNFFSGWSGPSTREDGLMLTNVSVNESILDFRSSEEQWKKILAARATVQKEWAERAAADIASTRIPPDTPDFSFIADQKLRHIIERDYAELQKAKQGSALKTRLILSGGLIEALLVDTLERVGEAALKARTAEKDNKGRVKSLDDRTLSSLIDVAAELSLISDGAVRLSDMVRDSRNLVHAGKERRGDYVIGQHEAEGAEAGLNAVIRDLRERTVAPQISWTLN